MELRVVEFRIGRGTHDIPFIHQNRIVKGQSDAAVLGNILVKLDIHDPVFRKSMHLGCFRPPGFDKLQRVWNGDLVDHNLAFGQGRFRDSVPGLDDGGLDGLLGDGNSGGFPEKILDAHGIDRIVRALVNYLEGVGLSQKGGGKLDPSCPPSIWQGHFTAAKRHLVSGDGHGLEYSPADHLLGLFVQIGEIIHRNHPLFLLGIFFLYSGSG